MLVILWIFTNMFKFFKQAFIALLSFSGSVARVAMVYDSTKFISLNNETCSSLIFT